ncbi:pyridoxamine 5'-phosphate oxidase family protein [Limnobacter sp.]|uniref:pyridoxamine 5'-phosphate oxidase family protein n=1 Tax=Limnobacter sp. TaxID=2003368 RepID=UPI00258A6384|nr:pyridoxamine 5'-phosphate oxidase family protein [Limnobacter sp.]
MNHAVEIWQTLLRATVDKKHPWRVVSFCTASAEGPAARSVILRGADVEHKRLVFYTDSRSQKMSHLQHTQAVALLFWNPRSNEQLRLTGKAYPLTDDTIVNAHWQRIPDYARKDYATLSAPGAATGAEVVHDFSLARQHFTVLEFQAEHMDWLKLDREGHQRLGFALNRQTGTWDETALVP